MEESHAKVRARLLFPYEETGAENRREKIIRLLLTPIAMYNHFAEAIPFLSLPIVNGEWEVVWSLPSQVSDFHPGYSLETDV